jgi:hypothetical protein
MINSRMRAYDYYLIGDDNGYGQITLIRDDNAEPLKQGEVKIAISTLTKAVTDDIRYSDASYIGLTQDKLIKDTYVIQYGEELLKVQYVIPDGRYTQVYLGIYG